MKTVGSIRVVEHGQGWTLNVYRFLDTGDSIHLMPYTVFTGGEDLQSAILKIARSNFGTGKLHRCSTAPLAVSEVEIYEVLRTEDSNA